MQQLITHIDKSEVLRYLGHQGSDIPLALDQLIDQCIELTIQTITPKFLYQRFSLIPQADGIHLEQTPIVLTGNDIREHLANCQQGYLLCLTLGLSIEKMIRVKMISNPDQGVILDSCASTAVEHLADYAEKEIAAIAAKEQLNLTWRFSPGYGDLPLSVQKNIISVMNTYQKIGLTLNDNLLLTPNKSVTAIIGLSNTKLDKRTNKCDFCNNQNHCAFRKKGKQC